MNKEIRDLVVQILKVIEMIGLRPRYLERRRNEAVMNLVAQRKRGVEELYIYLHI